MRVLLRTFIQRLTALFRRRRLEDDLDEELRSHLEMAIELNVRKGMSAADAHHEALRSFGGAQGSQLPTNILRLSIRHAAQRGIPLALDVDLGNELREIRFRIRGNAFQLANRLLIANFLRLSECLLISDCFVAARVHNLADADVGVEPLRMVLSHFESQYTSPRVPHDEYFLLPICTLSPSDQFLPISLPLTDCYL